MKHIYVIFDNVMEEVSTIFIANNDNHAMMIFENSLKRAREAGYQSEFNLKNIGDLDMSTGEVKYVNLPAVVVNPTNVDTSDEQKELF